MGCFATLSMTTTSLGYAQRSRNLRPPIGCGDKDASSAERLPQQDEVLGVLRAGCPRSQGAQCQLKLLVVQEFSPVRSNLRAAEFMQ